MWAKWLQDSLTMHDGGQRAITKYHHQIQWTHFRDSELAYYWRTIDGGGGIVGDLFHLIYFTAQLVANNNLDVKEKENQRCELCCAL